MCSRKVHANGKREAYISVNVKGRYLRPKIGGQKKKVRGLL